MMAPLLLRAFLRHLRRHPVQLATTLAGIALGVAVSVAVDLANESASAAFDLSVAGVAGKSTHQIVGGPSQLDEALYPALRRSGIPAARTAAPVVEGFVLARTGKDATLRRLRLLGIDPLANDLRDFAAPAGANQTSLGDPGGLLTRPATVALVEGLAAELGVAVGEAFAVEVGGRTVELEVGALLATPTDAAELQRDLLVADLATAQEVLGRLGRLSRIDLKLDAADLPQIEAWLPAEAQLIEVAEQNAALGEMTAAFRLNLAALSGLALLVGLFLIYNTMSFLVVERRPLIGRLRALGVLSGEIFRLVLLESALLGAIGTLAGLAIGIALAHGLIGLVSQAINDLYFAVEVRKVALPPLSLARGLALGLAGSLLAALPAAREAAAAPPRTVLLRSDLEGRARVAWRGRLMSSLLLALVAGALLLWPSRAIAPAFAGIFAAVLAFALLVPGLVQVAAALAERLFVRRGVVARLVWRGIGASLSRVGVALAALVVAIAATVGVDLMVRSFRGTLISWLDHTLQADFYLAGSAANARGLTTRAFDPALLADIAAWPGVELTRYRRVQVESPDGRVSLHAVDFGAGAFATLNVMQGGDQLETRFRSGEGILISEPFGWRHGLGVGDRLELHTDRGRRDFTVLGVFEDFATDRGYVLIAKAAYDQVFDDRDVQTLALKVTSRGDPADVRRRLDALAAAQPELMLRANGDLKQLSLAIFDRTFTITRVLRYLAVGVAFLGIVSALMALQLEKAREAAILRALGMTPGELWALVLGQTGALGLLAGLLALPLGQLLALLLVRVINKRSFGWTLHLELGMVPLLDALLLALAAALLAGLYPAWRVARTPPAAALREE